MIGLIGDADRARMFLINPHPTLALYLIAHEGSSSGAVVGLGSVPKRWSRARIEELANCIDGNNTRVYRGHRKGGGKRTPIGRVIRCFTKENGGGLEAIALVLLIDPKSAEDALMKILDAASIEAELSLEPDGDFWKVARVENVTGLALAEKNGHHTGFPRAGLIAAVRETTDDAGIPDTHSPELDKESPRSLPD